MKVGKNQKQLLPNRMRRALLLERMDKGWENIVKEKLGKVVET